MGREGKEKTGAVGAETDEETASRARETRWFARGEGRSWVGVTARRGSVVRAEMEAWDVCAWLALFFSPCEGSMGVGGERWLNHHNNDDYDGRSI